MIIVIVQKGIVSLRLGKNRIIKRKYIYVFAREEQIKIKDKRERAISEV